MNACRKSCSEKDVNATYIEPIDIFYWYEVEVQLRQKLYSTAMPYSSSLTDEEWEILEPLLPRILPMKKQTRRGRYSEDTVGELKKEPKR